MEENASGGEDGMLLASSSNLWLSLGTRTSAATGMGGSITLLGKPMATNNFVTKLYQCVLSSSFLCYCVF